MTYECTALNSKNKNWFLQIKYFRIGDFKEANEAVQNSWIMFVGKMMPCVSKNWADEAIRISSLLSKQTTPSDEAMALTVLEKKMKYWLVSPEDIPNDEDLEGF